MTYQPNNWTKKILLKLIQTLVILLIATNVQASQSDQTTIEHKLHWLEQKYKLKIGVYAFDTNSEKVIAYHAQDRFPFQSTAKFMVVSALLSNKNKVLQQEVVIQPQDLVFWHPISGQYVHQAVTLQKLAEGAISYSDNTATNMLIHQLGGLQAINQFAHNIGNLSFNMDNYEVNLNSSPDQNSDTATPEDMGLSMQKILLGEIVSPENKNLLLTWMQNNTTGYTRIRAGVPLGWSVADKTGSGRYGIANDIGIVWSPACGPVVLSIFTISDNPNAKPKDKAVAKITATVLQELEQFHPCYQATRIP
jgi:beta-lactamase class A